MFSKNKKKLEAEKYKQRRGFFERLTGAVHLEEDEYLDEEENFFNETSVQETYHESSIIEEQADGELAVDVLNTSDSIIVKAMIAGVRPGDIDIDISRDMITIKAKREDEHEIRNANYFQRELFWGSFSRNILLPEEVDVDEAEAKEKNGLLIITLPKIDKHKKTKLQVRG
jgi:HSP20 family molecular chaperone IbpA